MFLAFQYPVEIPGVTNMNFLKTALNAIRKSRGENELDAMQMLKLLRGKAKTLGMSEEMLKRAVNVGFSGGEKKRNEYLQMAVLEPAFCCLMRPTAASISTRSRSLPTAQRAAGPDRRCWLSPITSACWITSNPTVMLWPQAASTFRRRRAGA